MKKNNSIKADVRRSVCQVTQNWKRCLKTAVYEMEVTTFLDSEKAMRVRTKMCKEHSSHYNHYVGNICIKHIGKRG